MAVIENRVSRKIRRHLAKTGFEARLPSGAADAGFRIANDPRRAIDNSARKERLNSQVRRSRIATGISDKPGSGDSLAAELGQSIDGFVEQFRHGVVFLVPTLVCGR